MSKMIFTDIEPDFPYQSSELSKELGVPDSPLVHLAISSLAERLLPTAETAFSDTRIQRIQALRSASYAVLMCETSIRNSTQEWHKVQSNDSFDVGFAEKANSAKAMYV